MSSVLISVGLLVLCVFLGLEFECDECGRDLGMWPPGKCPEHG